MTKKLNKRKMTANDWQVLSLACLGLIFVIMFVYIPMSGLVLAFKDGDKKYDILGVIFHDGFVGLENFRKIFDDYNFVNVLVNTIGLNLICLVVLFPMPILFALMLNEIFHAKYKGAVQTICILPNFLSWMVFGGICLGMMDMTSGIINPVLEILGLSSPDNPVNLGEPQYFWATMVITSMIKGTGWGSIIYTAAIAGISMEMYEAADIEGVNRWQAIRYITLPSIASTITVFLLLNISGLLNNSFEHVYVFQNAINLERGEVLATYSWKLGISARKYSFTTALGLLQSIVSVILLTVGNFTSKKIAGRGLF